MALSVVQTKTANNVANVNSSTLTFDSTPTAGNLIVVCISGWRASGSGGFEVPAGSVTDNKGNNYRIAVVGDKNGSTKRAAIFYAFNILSSATFTVTLDPTGTGNYYAWSITEVAGASRSDPLDKTAQQQSSGTSVSTTATAATSQANEIAFSTWVGTNTLSSCAVGGGYTEIYEQLDAASFIPGEGDYLILSATGAQTCTWTINTTSGYSACIATFKELNATTFPTTGILDDFNRANAASLGVNWTDGLNGHAIVSNTAAGENAGFNISSYNTPPSSANQECYLTMSTVVTAGKAGVYVRWDGVGGNGYGLTAHVNSGDNEFNTYRTDNFVDTSLGVVNMEFRSGDKIGMSSVGSVISVYYQPSGGSWEFVTSYTDANYSNVGLIEMVSFGTAMRMDDFGGGGIASLVRAVRRMFVVS